MSNKRYKDLNMLFTKHPGTNDITRVYDKNAIKQSVRNLIMLSPYDVPFHPEIGCNIRSLLFENVSTITSIHIQQMIRNVIDQYEPRVKITSITVYPTVDKNGYDISIQFEILNEPNPTTMNFKLDKLK